MRVSVGLLSLYAFLLDRLGYFVSFTEASDEFPGLFRGQRGDVSVLEWHWTGASRDDKKRL